MSILSVQTDGSCMPNPGGMGIGIVIYEGTSIIKTISEYIGEGTNNIAEYSALIRGLEEIKKLKKPGDRIMVFVDSLLILRQAKGDWQVRKEELKPLCERARGLINEIGNIEIIWNTRGENGIADSLAKEAIYIKRAKDYKAGKGLKFFPIDLLPREEE